MPDGGIKAGPIGRALRLLVGLALAVEGSRHLAGNADLTLATLGVLVGLFFFYAALHLVIVRIAPGINAWVGAILAAVPLLTVYVLTDSPGKLGSVLFVAISLQFTALRNDAGCEVMTLPGMLLGRRTHLVCVAFSPVDWLEEKLAGRGGRGGSHA